MARASAIGSLTPYRLAPARNTLWNASARTQEKRREIHNNEPLPALSVMYHVSDAWKLFANYETSFGSLQYFQLGQGGTGDQTTNGLNPEKT